MDGGKLYFDKEQKSSGEMWDVIANKLLIFKNCCCKVGLCDDQFHNALSIMLKGRANLKTKILNQLPTLQRASQRQMAAIASSILEMNNQSSSNSTTQGHSQSNEICNKAYSNRHEMGIWLRDISQAYIQLNSKLNRFVVREFHNHSVVLI